MQSKEHRIKFEACAALLQWVWYALEGTKPRNEILSKLQIDSFMIAVGRGEEVLDRLNEANSRHKGVQDGQAK